MSTRERMNGIVKHLITVAITGLMTFSLTELKLCGDVERREIQLAADIAAQKETARLMNTRVDKISDSFSELIKQNAELIMLLRVQNQLKGTP